ncbi:MAG: membrane protein insertion efficiency factor YidD [Flavobacteriales bacterium]|nr:membrane protein insertion efficiency factor YidD [Flavobacteriales bacterium]
MRWILTKLIMGIIKLYQILISPLYVSTCRYSPTCSAYAQEALLKHGPFKGTYLTVRRILSCHPWGNDGYDPVP